MEFVVFSDLHGNSRALKAMLSALDPSRTYAFICCGDITGYYYDELEIMETLLRLPRLSIVKGNHDAMYCRAEKDEGFRKALCEKYGNAYKTIQRDVCAYLSQLPEKISLSADEKRILIVHGTDQFPLLGRLYPDTCIDTAPSEYDIVFCGHTHYSMVRKHGNTRIINPGSLGQPRDGRGFAYGIFDTKTGNWSQRTIKFSMDSLLRQIEERDPGNSYLRSVLFRGENSGYA